jgi:hypothetical protein
MNSHTPTPAQVPNINQPMPIGIKPMLPVLDIHRSRL